MIHWSNIWGIPIWLPVHPRSVCKRKLNHMTTLPQLLFTTNTIPRKLIPRLRLLSHWSQWGLWLPTGCIQVASYRRPSVCIHHKYRNRLLTKAKFPKTSTITPMIVTLLAGWTELWANLHHIQGGQTTSYCLQPEIDESTEKKGLSTYQLWDLLPPWSNNDQTVYIEGRPCNKLPQTLLWV